MTHKLDLGDPYYIGHGGKTSAGGNRKSNVFKLTKLLLIFL